MIKGSIADYAQQGKLMEAIFLLPREYWNQIDVNGGTLLHYACIGNNRKAVAFLLNLGFDVNARDRFGNMPLHIAALFNVSDSIDLLLAAGASVRMNNQDLKTPIEIAREEWKDAVSEELVYENVRLIGRQADQAQLSAFEEVILQCRSVIAAFCVCAKKKGWDAQLRIQVAISIWSCRRDACWNFMMGPRQDRVEHDDDDFQDFLKKRIA